MLKIYEYNTKDFTKGCLGFLDAASNVHTVSELNGSCTLDFDYPCGEKIEIVKENRIAVCEGQAYRIMKISRSDNGQMVSVSCAHIYEADAKAVHIPTIADYIGKSPRMVIEKAFENTPFKLMSDYKIGSLGLKWVDADGLLIDFFEVDKTTPYDVMSQIIENCGKGELYIDNYNIALVERIGKDTNLSIRPEKNSDNISVEYDINNLVTRLYPYGYNDLTITSVHGVEYIDSDNQSVYGVKCGYKDYSDYTVPADVYNNALWEFDERNPNRIDVPAVNISCSVTDLYKMAGREIETLHLGDTVNVFVGGIKIRERIIKLDTYPYEPQKSNVEIGRVKADLFFYMNQFGKLGHKYKRVSTVSGNVTSNKLTGIINTSKNNIKSENGYLEVIDDRMRIVDKNKRERVFVGNQNNVFRFKLNASDGKIAAELTEDGFILYDKAGNEVIKFDNDGNGVFAGSIDTEKDVKVGEKLYLSVVNGGNLNVNSGVCWKNDGGGTRAMIGCTSDGMSIYCANDITLWIRGTNRGTIGELVNRVEALEKKIG